MPTLDFKGKQQIYAHHLTVPYRPLLPDADRSLNANGADGNLIIHGDNLEALRALIPRYADRVKCVYIDPPYNTGNEGWCYNDKVNSPLMRAWLAQNGRVDGEDMERHEKWLCMMWPRLQLLKELLAEDGAIFVSVDDNECHHLRMVMDEIFGEENFVGTFVWEGTGKNDARFISVGHDYILCYAREMESLSANGNRWRVQKEGIAEIYRVVKELKETHLDDFTSASEELKDWFSSLDKKHKSWVHRHYNWIDERGVYFAGDISWPGSGGPQYEVLHPKTGNPVKIPAGGWRFPLQETMMKAMEEDRVHFGPDESRVPNLKRYLHETDDQILTSVFYQDRRAAHKNLVKILPDEQFDYPKDERVISRILELVASDNDIVLDSFAGSGTTAHAVLALNKEDGGNRKFILIECEDHADTVCAERVRRVIRGVPGARDAALREGLGGSFAYCTLGPPTELDAMLTGEALPPWPALAAYLLHTATGVSAGPDDLAPLNEDGLFHEGDTTDYYLLYEPDLEYLRGHDAMLNAERAEHIEAANRAGGKKAVVFGAGKYILQSELTPMGILFCQLPWELLGKGQGTGVET